MSKPKHLNPDLHALQRPVEGLTEDPRNARKHGPRNLDSIKTSLAKYGQQKPIVVDGDGVIIAGNGTWRAACELGWETIAAVTFNGPDAHAKGFGIADNRTAELATWDEDVLGELLAELAADELDPEDMGFTEDEVHALMQGWGVQQLDEGAIDPHNEDGKHGMIKIERIDLEERDAVAEIVRKALADAGFDYKATAC